MLPCFDAAFEDVGLVLSRGSEPCGIVGCPPAGTAMKDDWRRDAIERRERIERMVACTIDALPRMFVGVANVDEDRALLDQALGIGSFYGGKNSYRYPSAAL